MYTLPTAPRSIGGVLDDAFRLYRVGFAKAWPIALLAQASVAIPLVILQLQVGIGTSVANIDPARLLAHWPLMVCMYLILVIASIIFQNAMLAQFVAQASNVVQSVWQSLTVSLRFLPRALGILFIYFGALLLAGIAMGILAAVLGGFARGVLFTCVIVGVLIIVVRLLLSTTVMIAEDTRAFAAIEGSWRLTRSNWWRVTGILTVLAIVVMVVTFVVSFAAGLTVLLLPKTGWLATVVTQLVSILGNSLFASLLPAGFLAIYFDLKLRRDGSDLAGRVDALPAG